MALSILVETESGVTVDNAYFKVNLIRGNKQEVEYFLYSYVSREASLQGKKPLTEERYAFIPDTADVGNNIFRQAYAHAKSLERFKNARDILEEGQKPL